MTDSIETTEHEAVDSTEALIRAKGLTAPRITSAELEAEIASEHYFTAGDGVVGVQAIKDAAGLEPGASVTARTMSVPDALDLLTLCVLVLHNGFTVVGKSAVVSPANFDAEIGRKVARADAVDQLWPLLGFRLRDRLLAQANPESA